MGTLYLIQCIIFTEGHVVSEGYKPSIRIAVKIQKTTMFTLSHGIVEPSGDGKTFCGFMNDKWGDSEITNFELNGDKLKFFKHYPNNPLIKFTFNKINNLWIGKWSGKSYGKGSTKCIITSIDDSFLEALEEPFNLKKELSKMLSAARLKVEKTVKENEIYSGSSGSRKKRRSFFTAIEGSIAGYKEEI